MENKSFKNNQSLSKYFRSDLEIDLVKTKDGKSMQALCMAQHYQMLRIYRRPGIDADEQIIFDRATSGDHIIVAHHNQVITDKLKI